MDIPGSCAGRQFQFNAVIIRRADQRPQNPSIQAVFPILIMATLVRMARRKLQCRWLPALSCLMARTWFAGTTNDGGRWQVLRIANKTLRTVAGSGRNCSSGIRSSSEWSDRT
jgi:hypothetical protein